MAETLLDVRVENVDEVAKILAKRAPERFQEAQMSAMKLSLADLKGHLVSDMEASKWSGEGSRRVRQRITGRPGTERFKGRVIGAPHGHLIEHGRAPGKGPFGGEQAERIKQWAKDKLGDERLWFVIARSIARKGTLKGKRPGFETGWGHMRKTTAERKDAVVRYFQVAIERAARLLFTK